MCPPRQLWAAPSLWWRREISSPSIFQSNKLELKVSDEVLAERRAKWQPREPKITTGYLARYAAMVTSGNRGAILEIPKTK